MNRLGKWFADEESTRPQDPFAARLLFECRRVPDNARVLTELVERFAAHFPDRILGNPRVHQGTDGNVIELSLFCLSRGDIDQFNEILERLARERDLID